MMRYATRLIVARLLSLLIALGSLRAEAADRDPAGYERVLLPVVLGSHPVSGAFGSTWVTELAIRNESTSNAHVFQSECAFFCTCVPILCSVPEAAPGQPVFVPFTPNFDGPGTFLYVGKTQLPDIAIQLRVRDISRSATNFGTELPVVRSGEFLSTVAYLLDIPIDDRFRQHLRIYGLPQPSEVQQVDVEVYSVVDRTMLARRTLTLVPGGSGTVREDPAFPAYPSYGEIASLKTLIASVDEAPDRVFLRIVPATAGLQFWAFVAITNNETQHVTLVTPW